jgi:hypothetical protein
VKRRNALDGENFTMLEVPRADANVRFGDEGHVPFPALRTAFSCRREGW